MRAWLYARSLFASACVVLLLTSCAGSPAGQPCNSSLTTPDVANIQLYPTAHDVVRTAAAGAEPASLSYRSQDTPENVIAWYDNSLSEDGWRRVRSTAIPVGELLFEWNNCCQVGWVDVTARSQDAAWSAVTVKYEMQKCPEAP